MRGAHTSSGRVAIRVKQVYANFVHNLYIFRLLYLLTIIFAFLAATAAAGTTRCRFKLSNFQKDIYERTFASIWLEIISNAEVKGCKFSHRDGLLYSDRDANFSIYLTGNQDKCLNYSIYQKQLEKMNDYQQLSYFARK